MLLSLLWSCRFYGLVASMVLSLLWTYRLATIEGDTWSLILVRQGPSLARGWESVLPATCCNQVSVVKRRVLTPQSRAFSICYTADRRPNPAPINTPRFRPLRGTPTWRETRCRPPRRTLRRASAGTFGVNARWRRSHAPTQCTQAQVADGDLTSRLIERSSAAGPTTWRAANQRRIL